MIDQALFELIQEAEGVGPLPIDVHYVGAGPLGGAAAYVAEKRRQHGIGVWYRAEARLKEALKRRFPYELWDSRDGEFERSVLSSVSNMRIPIEERADPESEYYAQQARNCAYLLHPSVWSHWPEEIRALRTRFR